MSLQTVLAEIDPGWYAVAGEPVIEPALLARARGSALGERLLARWLLTAGHAGALLTPTPEREIGNEAVRWPRARLQPFVRDLGVLAFAPAIRAEVGRDTVRQLKQALGNSYLLALDKTVWDGRVDTQAATRMNAAWRGAVSGGDPEHAILFALLDRQGRSELRSWESQEARALGEWAALLHPREDTKPDGAVLPAAQVRLLYEHHLGRARSA